jgi:hypothetical protein
MDLYHQLPQELGDLIMRLVDDVDDNDTAVGALFLALTCSLERARYARIIPTHRQRTLRPLLIHLAACEGTLVDGGDTVGYVLPGEKGYAYYKDRELRARRALARRIDPWNRRRKYRKEKKARRDDDSDL